MGAVGCVMTGRSFSFVYFDNQKYNELEIFCVENGGTNVNYLTVKEIGEKWGLTGRMVTYYCEAGQIRGALKKGNLWFVPIDADKPLDGRFNKSLKTTAKQTKALEN